MYMECRCNAGYFCDTCCDKIDDHKMLVTFSLGSEERHHFCTKECKEEYEYDL